MARSEIKTWLSLDEFAKIIGLSPLGFNQLYSPTLQNNNVCGDIFFTSSWQHSDRVGRDDIAMAISQAEQEMTREAGFNLMPDWTTEERLNYPRPGIPELYGIGINPRYMNKSVEAIRGMIIAGGTKATTLVQAGAPVVRSDTDTDGYLETATVVVPITTTDLNEVHAYYPSKNGADAWEIRPITVSISGGFATITFKSWQIAAANQMDSLDAQPLDADNAASYETTVDVYRVYHDPSTQVQFMWENGSGCAGCCGSCLACQYGTQAGCLHMRDARMGFIVPSPASWNQETQSFDSQPYSACREPDQVRLWYRSGYVDPSLPRPYAEMSPYWKYAVAYFAASKFERPVCGCSNVNQFIEKWRRDASYSSMQEGGFTKTAEIMANRLGTSAGALYAYQRIHANGVAVNK